MASDEDDDLEILRQAALATLRKKPAVVEDIQPIPQLTSSGHSLQGSSSSPWADDFMPDGALPFHDTSPVSQFQDGPWGQQFQPPPYGQNSPTHYSASNWRGGHPNYPFHKPLQHGRGSFPPHGPRLPFGATLTTRPPFIQNPITRPPYIQNHTTGPPFIQTLPPFGAMGQAPPPRGGNLIVINTLPDEGAAPEGPRFPANRFPFVPRGRGGPRGGAGPSGRGAGRGGGQNTNAVVSIPMETSSKPVLIRPQDKYCPSAEPTSDSQDSMPSQRKKKDKFSRFESSGTDSDDESSEEEDEETRVAKSASGSLLNDSQVTENDNDGQADQDPDSAVADTELSISVSAVNSSRQESDLEESASDVELGDGGDKTSDISQEMEDRLLASPTPQESEHSGVEESVNSRPTSAAASEERVQSLPPSPHTDSGTGSKSASGSSSDGVGNESDTSTSSSNDSSSSGSSSDSDSESGGEGKSSDNSSAANSGRSRSPSQNSAASGEEGSEKLSDSDSEETYRTGVRRLPAERNVRASGAKKGISHPAEKETQPARTLTPEEQAKLDARKRKFEMAQEVKVTGKTISLKGIVPRSKRPKPPPKTKPVPVKTVPTSKTPTRVVSKLADSKPTGTTHRKHARRRVSIEEPSGAGSGSESQTENQRDEEEEEDQEEESGRAWKREANQNVKQKTAVHVDQALPGAAPYFGNSQRGHSRNGGYRRGYGPRDQSPRWQRGPRDTRPEVHYSSSDSEDGRKLISVVVPRSAAGSVGHSRKRQVDSSAYDDDSRGGGFVTKSKRVERDTTSSDRTGSISVVISSGDNAKRPPKSSSSRMSVHQRLGSHKGGESRANVKPVSRAQTDSDIVSSRVYR